MLCATRPFSFVYYEAFVIKKPNDEDPLAATTDNARYGPGLPRGDYTQIGTVKFFCMRDKGKVDPAYDLDWGEFDDWKKDRANIPNETNPCKTTAGKLPYVTTKPNFWDDPLISKSKSIERFFRVEWDCCDPNNKMDVFSVPGKDKGTTISTN